LHALQGHLATQFLIDGDVNFAEATPGMEAL
jgi:hypothetical protein